MSPVLGTWNLSYHYSNIDYSDKSISLPMGAESFVGELKDYFYRKGYRVVSHQGGTREIVLNKKEKVIRREHATRYMLFYKVKPIELVCFFDTELSFNFSLLDSKTGKETMILTGEGCGKSIAKTFIKAFEERR